jgi:hypothetical protein
MKIIASILILLMFGMAVAPCGDAAETENLRTEQIDTADTFDAMVLDYEADEHQEACSPLCPCQCCPSIDSYDITVSQLSAIIPFNRPSTANSIPSSDFSVIVWTPPQLLS